ncbi:hypothetical protein A3758_15650 [Oleiphilus sp. HI0118]|nr:hypothetical protein A3758_15650 [Oleiphilus sp. HI0118]
MSFDGLTFSGTPTNAEVGSLQIEVTAEDGQASASTTFSLDVTNVNDAPEVSLVLVDQAIDEDAAWSFGIPAGSFTDVDTGDSLTFTAQLANGDPLPSWLSFDAVTQTFSGTPGQLEIGTLSIEVIATDTAGATVSDVFDVTVNNVNDAPVIVTNLIDLNAMEGAAFSYTLPADSFADIDVGDVLSYSATLSDGSALPTWLSFDDVTGTFSGTPDATSSGALLVRVTATDQSGSQVSDDFGLFVQDADPIVIEAESGVLGSHKFASNHAGYSGGGFVDMVGEGELSYTIDANAGSYSLDIRYALGNGSRPLELYVNDTLVETIDFTATGGWKNWQTVSRQVELTSGTNSVRLVTTGSSGANIDQLVLTPLGSVHPSSVEVAGVTYDAMITGSDFDDVLNGRDQSEVIDAAAGDDTLAGSAGNDLLIGGAGNDVYDISIGDGQDVIDATQGYVSGDMDQLRLDASLSVDDVWFNQSGADLKVTLLGTADTVTVLDWASTDNAMDQVTLGGAQIDRASIDQLVSAMASYGAPSGGAISLTSEEQQQVSTSIAAAWS